MNKAILRVEDALERHNVMLERATGEDRIALIDKKTIFLKKNKKYLIKPTMSIGNGRTRDFLERVDVTSSTGGASDYERLMINRQKQIDSVTSQINAIKYDSKDRDALIEKRCTKRWNRV